MQGRGSRGLGLAAAVSAGSGAEAAAIVAPCGQDSAEGNINNGFPLDARYFGPTRTQQVYASSEFALLGRPAIYQSDRLPPGYQRRPVQGDLPRRPDRPLDHGPARRRPEHDLRRQHAGGTNRSSTRGRCRSSAWWTPPGPPAGLRHRRQPPDTVPVRPLQGQPAPGYHESIARRDDRRRCAELGGDGTSRVYAYGKDLSQGNRRLARAGHPVPDRRSGGPPPAPLPTTVPEPGPIAVLGLGFVILLGRRLAAPLTNVRQSSVSRPASTPRRPPGLWGPSQRPGLGRRGRLHGAPGGGLRRDDAPAPPAGGRLAGRVERGRIAVPVRHRRSWSGRSR